MPEDVSPGSAANGLPTTSSFPIIVSFHGALFNDPFIPANVSEGNPYVNFDPENNPACNESPPDYSYDPEYEDQFRQFCGMDLDPPQLQQEHTNRIPIIEPLTVGEGVQIHSDRNGSRHHISPVPNCGGNAIVPFPQLQLAGCQPEYHHMQLDTQPGVPLTGPSNEARIPVVGTPGNITNAGLDPHADLKRAREGIVDKLSKSPYLDATRVKKMLRKCAKDTVTSFQARVASERRRKVDAKFECSVKGCGSSFTRKHNLTNHTKSHLGITDHLCAICEKGFTTRATMRRHEKKHCSLEVDSFSMAPMNPNRLAQIQKDVRSSLNQP